MGLRICLFIFNLMCFTQGQQFHMLQFKDISQSCYQRCVIIVPEIFSNERALNIISSTLELSYRDEPEVTFSSTDFSVREARNYFKKRLLDTDLHNSFLIFKRTRKDRTCLMTPPSPSPPEPQIYSFEDEKDYDEEAVVDFINYHCHTFRQSNGNLTPQGLHKEYILNNLYSVSKSSISRVDGQLAKSNVLDQEKQIGTGDSFCEIGKNSLNNDCSTKREDEKNIKLQSPSEKYSGYFSQEMQKCDRIEMPAASKFFNDYLTVSKPVVITGATLNWPVFEKWTNTFLMEKYGDTKVHIKITPNGEYEGVEPISLWENRSKIKIPKDVLEQLPFADLVVVRPATMEIKFAEFIKLIERISASKNSNISAYLEYSSISYFSNLKEDIDEMSFIKKFLQLKHTNIWLSDGNTIGKLHFDPFDNLMCQISGEKEFIIYEPHANERLYEAHIQEAMLSYNASSKSFSRQNLLESTSMVMSPVDIEKPDLKKFPRFAETTPLSCTIKPGDVLFTPAFWWHEVRSKPNSTEGRNLAVNFWYEPFFQKEFPCPECRLFVNPHYFHLL